MAEQQILFDLPPDVFRNLEFVARTNKVSLDSKHLNAYTQAVEYMRFRYPSLHQEAEAKKLLHELYNSPDTCKSVFGRMKLMIACGISMRAR